MSVKVDKTELDIYSHSTFTKGQSKNYKVKCLLNQPSSIMLLTYFNCVSVYMFNLMPGGCKIISKEKHHFFLPKLWILTHIFRNFILPLLLTGSGNTNGGKIIGFLMGSSTLWVFLTLKHKFHGKVLFSQLDPDGNLFLLSGFFSSFK